MPNEVDGRVDAMSLYEGWPLLASRPLSSLTVA